MYKNWASDGEVTRFLTWQAYSGVETAKAVLSDWTADYDKADNYNWAIELKEIGEVIGSITVVHITGNTGSAELGYCIGRSWWGSGIMPEAAKAVVRYLFGEVGFARISATHAKDNPKSGRVMQKIGMTYEGTLRRAGSCNQGVVDLVCYSILRDEYQNFIP